MRPIPNLTDEAAELALHASGWFVRLGRHIHFPATLGQAAELLHVGGEYDITADQLEELTARGLVSAPADGLWGAADVVQAGAVLDARRQWVPTPSLHDVKKHPLAVNLETARTSDSVADQLAANVPAGEVRADLRHLLVLITEADAREVREKIRVHIAAVLEVDHGVII